MKNFEKILLFLTILLVVFNLTQLNIYNFLGDENRIALICFILSLCALILILILMISKRIKNNKDSQVSLGQIQFVVNNLFIALTVIFREAISFKSSKIAA